MILFRDPSRVPADFGPSAVAIGKFDGVHAGHRALISAMIAEAANAGERTVAVTFDRNPLALLAPERCPPPLLGIEQKAAVLAETGVDATLLLRFDEALAGEPAEHFVRRVLVDALRAAHVLVGSDFRFGKGNAGDVALLRELGAAHGFAVHEIPDVVNPHGSRRVSSTWIRELLAAGDVTRARELLGRPASVRGEIVHGLKRGRDLGFPTANLAATLEGFVPADGVYAGWLVDQGQSGDLAEPVRYPAAISVGVNPTFGDVDVRQVEAYVLDEADLDLYGHIVEVQFSSHVRGMVAFGGVDALGAQIADDVDRVRDALAASQR